MLNIYFGKSGGYELVLCSILAYLTIFSDFFQLSGRKYFLTFDLIKKVVFYDYVT